MPPPTALRSGLVMSHWFRAPFCTAQRAETGEAIPPRDEMKWKKDHSRVVPLAQFPPFHTTFGWRWRPRLKSVEHTRRFDHHLAVTRVTTAGRCSTRHSATFDGSVLQVPAMIRLENLAAPLKCHPDTLKTLQLVWWVTRTAEFPSWIMISSATRHWLVSQRVENPVQWSHLSQLPDTQLAAQCGHALLLGCGSQ